MKLNLDSNIRAGIIYTDGTKVLIEHPTNYPFILGKFDIPKGHIHLLENIKKGAVREFYEECNLLLDPDSLVPIVQREKYRDGYLYIYVCVVKNLWPIDKFKCTSFVKLPLKTFSSESDKYLLFLKILSIGVYCSIAKTSPINKKNRTASIAY